MMKHLNDDQLEVSADKARSKELSALQDMLNHLREIDRRKLFSKRGYSSIYEYGIQRFKYSSDEIHRRVQAMRLLKDVPEAEAKIATGELKLTHLTEAQSFFKKVEHTKEEKLEVLKKLENTTKAETKKILYNQGIKARYSFEADQNLENTIERLKGLHPHLSFDELMKKICEMALKKLDPAAKAERVRKDKKKTAEKSRSDLKANRSGAEAKTRYIPADIKREVWLKAEGKCQNCKSTFALEFDHITPYAKGGANTKENLRLLCRSCNQRKAIEHYGLKKIEKFTYAKR